MKIPYAYRNHACASSCILATRGLGYMGDIGVYRSVAIALTILFVAATTTAAILYTRLYSATMSLLHAKDKLKTTEASLAKCRDKLRAAEKRISLLESNISRLTEDNQALTGRLKACVSENKRLEAENRNLTARLRMLQDRYRALYENYTRLQSKLQEEIMAYTSVLAKLNATEKRLEAALAELAALRSNYTRLRNSYNSLQERYAALKEAYSTLTEKLKAAQENYTRLRNAYDLLLYDKQRLQEELTALRDRLDAAEEKLAEAEENLTTLSAEYQELRSLVYQADSWLGVYNSTEAEARFYTMLLNASIDTAKKLVDLLGYSGDLGRRALEVFRDVTVYLTEYVPDDYVRYVNPETLELGTIDNVWQLPNETYINGGGDCEDLALLVYSVLAANSRPGEKLYLVLFNSLWVGHAIVLGVEKTPTGPQYYAIDPAGNWFNGLSTMLRLEAKANDTMWYLYLNPAEMAPRLKRWLLDRRFATIVYRDHYTQTYNETVNIPYYTSAFTALDDLIVRYWELPGVDKIIVIAPNVYKEFTSITDAAKWIEMHG